MGTYTYNGSHPHAVASTSANNWSFQYDANGNMTTRNAGNIYTLSYDAENRVTAVSGGGISASFVYDGDGNRVQATVSGVTTTFVGAYEWTANGNTLYYSAGGARVAMRRSGYPSDNGLFWILGICKCVKIRFIR